MSETDNKDVLAIFGIIITALLVILIALLGLDIPVVPVCILILIEAALALCLHNVPIWLHAVAIIAQAIAGYLSDNAILIVLCLLIYIFGILTLRFTEED